VGTNEGVIVGVYEDIYAAVDSVTGAFHTVMFRIKVVLFVALHH